MTTAQWVKSLKAKRAGPGKWMAKCPVHREKTASLSIKAGKTATLIHCFGCLAGGKQVAEVLGLTVRDLYYDSKPDLKAMREAERQRALEGRERRKKKDAIWRTVSERDYWRDRAERLGKLLAEQPDSDRLSSQFHLALDRARELDQSVVNQMVATYRFRADYFCVGE